MMVKKISSCWGVHWNVCQIGSIDDIYEGPQISANKNGFELSAFSKQQQEWLRKLLTQFISLVSFYTPWRLQKKQKVCCSNPPVVTEICSP